MTGSTPPSSFSPPQYSDSQAMDDIQALLTSPRQGEGEDAVAEIAEVITRTGRSMATPRLIHIEQGTADNGLPWALIAAEDTFICAVQDPDTDAISISVWAINGDDTRCFRIAVDGTVAPDRPDLEDPDTEGATRHPAERGAR